MGNAAQGGLVTGEEISMESTEAEIVLANSDIEDTESSTPEETIPNWIRWSTLALPIVVRPTDDEAKANIGPRYGLAYLNNLAPGKMKDIEDEFKKVPTPKVVGINDVLNHHPTGVTEDDVNKFSMAKGPAAVMEANYNLAQRILSESSAVASDKNTVWRLAICGRIAATYIAG